MFNLLNLGFYWCFISDMSRYRGLLGLSTIRCLFIVWLRIWYNCGSEDISFRAGGLFLAHHGLLLIMAVCWHVTTILPGAPPLPWVTRILHGQWFTCEAPWSVCGHHSPVVAEDLTRVIWGHSLCSELILGSKTVINCTWAGGGAVVVRGGGECFMIRGLRSDPPWPWWHRDNGSHGDTDMVITQC